MGTASVSSPTQEDITTETQTGALGRSSDVTHNPLAHDRPGAKPEVWAADSCTYLINTNTGTW